MNRPASSDAQRGLQQRTEIEVRTDAGDHGKQGRAIDHNFKFDVVAHDVPLDADEG